jgi:carbamoylphosphate synthase large subunit
MSLSTKYNIIFSVFLNDMSDSNVVVGNEEELGEGVLTSFEADDNQPNLVEQVEQVTNKKEYLIETMRDKTAEELAHF